MNAAIKQNNVTEYERQIHADYNYTEVPKLIFMLKYTLVGLSPILYRCDSVNISFGLS